LIEISIPGQRPLQLRYLVLDYNGTMACDGHPIDGLKEILQTLAGRLEIHVLTADTFGDVKRKLEGFPVTLSILPKGNQDEGKLKYVQKLGIDQSVCVGNGRNDCLMLKAAALGIALIQEEGACAQTLSAADIVCQDIISALGLLIHTKRLEATLRN